MKLALVYPEMKAYYQHKIVSKSEYNGQKNSLNACTICFHTYIDASWLGEIFFSSTYRKMSSVSNCTDAVSFLVRLCN